MAIVTKNETAGNQGQAQGNSVNPVAFAMLSKATGNEPWRDGLPAGSAFVADLTVSGTVNDEPITPYQIKGTVSVGFDSERASSVGPSQAHLLGLWLMKQNEATRAAFLRDTPIEFATNDNELPEVPAEIISAVEAMLKKLRASKRTPVRGSVSVNYALIEAKPATRRKKS